MGLQLTQVYDETEYIYSAVDLVRDNIFIGGASDDDRADVVLAPRRAHAVGALDSGHGRRSRLSVSLVLCGLSRGADRSWLLVRSGALVVGLAIPTSIIGTFLMLGGLGGR